MASSSEGKADREAGTVTYKFHENDYWIAVALLWSGVAWALSIGAVFLHLAGASSVVADVVALGVSVVVGLAWCVIVFIAEW